MVERLVSQVLSFQDVDKIIVTLNIPEELALSESERIVVLRNEVPQGFGANHNAAFRQCTSDFFCVLNPDIEFLDNPFSHLLTELEGAGAAVVAPLVVTSDGKIEDSVRRFPTVTSLLAKYRGIADGRYRIEPGQANIEPDWVAGMFMLFRSGDFAALGGFDEAFFLYYEDVDICARVWKRGGKVLFSPSQRVIHDAQRASHRSWRFRRWHLQSLIRYLLRYALRHPRRSSALRSG
jgi:GT2 family glycosyltransferase